MSIVCASKFYDPFSHEIRDPFAGYSNVSAPTRISIYDQLTAFANPHIDSEETPETLVIQICHSRLKKDEVKVHILGNKVLEISGERKIETEEKIEAWRRIERSSSKFVRKFKLPENVKVNQVKADLENGVLTVTVVKKIVVKKSS